MKRLLTFTVRLAGSVRKSVNNVLASRRLALEAREKRLALSATTVPFASPPTDSETTLCCTAQLDTDYMETIPIHQVQWSWNCEATYDILVGWIQSNVSYSLSYVLSPSLQEWSDNIRYYTNW